MIVLNALITVINVILIVLFLSPFSVLEGKSEKDKFTLGFASATILILMINSFLIWY